MYASDGIPTHYLYVPGFAGLREPTGLLCLSHASYSARKDILHNAVRNGELLAKLPTPVKTMSELRASLQGLGY